MGRSIRHGCRGLEWSGDPKHAQVLLRELNMDSCATVATPYWAESSGRDDNPLMNPSDAKIFRRAAARINYMSLDRPDLSMAAGLLSRMMASPRVGDEGQSSA